MIHLPIRFLICLAVAGNCSFGQLLSFGVKAGLRTNGALDPAAQHRDESKFYTVGPAMELAAPWKWRVEVDGLYRRMGDSGGDCVFTFCGFSRTRANSWEFPILAKRRFSIPGAAVYAGIGYSARRVGRATVQLVQYRTGPVFSGEVVDYTIQRSVRKSPAEVTHGLIAAGGIEFSAWKFKVAPEFRYTRWNKRFWEDFGSRGFFTGSNPDQYEILLGIRR